MSSQKQSIVTDKNPSGKTENLSPKQMEEIVAGMRKLNQAYKKQIKEIDRIAAKYGYEI